MKIGYSLHPSWTNFCLRHFSSLLCSLFLSSAYSIPLGRGRSGEKGNTNIRVKKYSAQYNKIIVFHIATINIGNY
jgi:hypothetical protein